jgi:hypothetical protein
MNISASQFADRSTSQLRQDYEAQKALFQVQLPIVQRFLEAQGRQIAEAIDRHSSQISFTLPDRVITLAPGEGPGETLNVPSESREQMAGGLVDRLTRAGLRTAFDHRLDELEGSNDRALVISAQLIRHAVVIHMVHGMLPAGRQVTYASEESEEIPSLPVRSNLEPESALMASTDAITEEQQEETGRGQLLVPFTPYARRFYLPQWVAFDEQDKLLVNSISEAEAAITSMKRFIDILHNAVGLAAYVVADEDYQQKRYGMLGQLVNQGRSLARYQTREIIQTIKKRADRGDLNRGLSLSLPYFDDQVLEERLHDFEVIPAGRIMFVPAFVVRAMRLEQGKIAQDTRLNPSTRKHLIAELRMIEEAFDESDRR